MHLIYEALKKTGGRTSGDAMVAAMKGMAWESPPGPMSIDPETRDVVHDRVYPQGGEGEQAAFQCGIVEGGGGQGR
jgi:branched-chain amino acid transport system substrate-binding protein